MEAKKTIAILGLEKGDEKDFLDQLANDNRLLIVSDINDCAKVSDYLSQNKQDQEVELITCPKDGCWEADIILIWNPSQHPVDHLMRLQSVAIQKIVVMITNEVTKEFPSFPHSKTVVVTINTTTKDATIDGENPEAVTVIKQLINRTSIFNINNK